MTPAPRRCRVADVLVFAAFAAVPLGTSAAFLDRYTTVKWYLLHLLAAAWLLAELWACGSRGWPRFVRDRWPAVAALAALAAWSTLRGGLAWGLSPAADRLACAALALCAAWYFARNGGRTAAVVAGTTVALAATMAVGFLQAAGVALPAPLAAREGPAALFGNVNMAAQFVGLALVLVIAVPGGRAWTALRIVLAAGGAFYLYLLSARSVLVALAAAAAALGWSTRRRVYVAAVAAAAVLLALAWLRPGGGFDPMVAAQKAQSTRLRLALWADTLTLVRDHPLGVGAGNFEHAFVPYQAAGRLEPQEEVVFRSPHDEYLRYLAEDGALFLAVALVLAVMLSRGWRRAAPPPELRALVVGWSAFLAVEAVFQFPLALAFGALATAITIGAAVAASGNADGPVDVDGRGAIGRSAGTIVALAIVAASLRIATSERLYVAHSQDRDALGRACALDPRNLPACVTAAWREAIEGDRDAARSRLAGVLAHAPAYPPAIKLLGDIALAEGNAAEACRRLSEYDALFRGRSASHAQAAQACAAAR